MFFKLKFLICFSGIHILPVKYKLYRKNYKNPIYFIFYGQDMYVINIPLNKYIVFFN